MNAHLFDPAMKSIILSAALIASLVGGASEAFAAETTLAQTVTEFSYDGQGDVTYIVGAAGWGAPACPGARYVQILSSVPGRKQLLAVVLTARGSGAAVSFAGECSTDSNYFSARYVTVR